MLMVGHLLGRKSDLVGLHPYRSNVCHDLRAACRVKGLRHQNPSMSDVCSLTNHTTSTFLKGDGVSQEEGRRRRPAAGLCSWGQDAGYAEVSLPLSPCSVQGFSLFDTPEPPSTDWWDWLWGWVGNSRFPAGSCMSQGTWHQPGCSLSKALHTFATVPGTDGLCMLQELLSSCN